MIAGPVSGLILTYSHWRWMFVIEAIPGLFWSLVWWRAIDDRPQDAKWLPERERADLIQKLAARGRGTGNDLGPLALYSVASGRASAGALQLPCADGRMGRQFLVPHRLEGNGSADWDRWAARRGTVGARNHHDDVGREQLGPAARTQMAHDRGDGCRRRAVADPAVYGRRHLGDGDLPVDCDGRIPGPLRPVLDTAQRSAAGERGRGRDRPDQRRRQSRRYRSAPISSAW